MAISPLWPAIVQNNGGFEKTNTDTIRFGRRSGKPVWQMAQWASRYDLGGTPPVRQADGSVAYANEGKRIVRSADGTLTLDITTSTEYRSPRTADGAWPHLLIQQDFTHRPNIGRIRHLYFAMDLRIEHCERRMSDEQYDESPAYGPVAFLLFHAQHESPVARLRAVALGRRAVVRLPLRTVERRRVRAMGHRHGDLHLCDSAPQHLGRRLVPRPGVAQRPARPCCR